MPLDEDGQPLGVPDPAGAAYIKADEKTYWAKQDVELQRKKLLEERMHGERMVLEHFRKRRPKLDVTAMITRGADLEDAGRLPEASAMYERALTQEPDLLELRMYIGQLTAKINRKYHTRKADPTEPEQMSAEMSPPLRGRAGLGAEFTPPPRKRNYGPVMPANPHLLAMEHRNQAAERRLREERQRQQDAMDDMRDLERQAQQLALDQYAVKVGRANAQLVAQRRLADNMLEVINERKRQEAQQKEYDEYHRQHREELSPNPMMGHAERDRMPFQDKRRDASAVPTPRDELWRLKQSGTLSPGSPPPFLNPVGVRRPASAGHRKPPDAGRPQLRPYHHQSPDSNEWRQQDQWSPQGRDRPSSAQAIARPGSGGGIQYISDEPTWGVMPAGLTQPRAPPKVLRPIPAQFLVGQPLPADLEVGRSPGPKKKSPGRAPPRATPARKPPGRSR